jgi:hypothetical protein
MVPLNSLLCYPQLLLDNLCLDPQVRELVSQPLGLDPQRLSFLLANLNLFLQHYRALNSDIILAFKIFQRGALVARLAFKIVVLHFNISEFHLQ